MLNEQCWFIEGKTFGPFWYGKIKQGYYEGGPAHVRFSIDYFLQNHKNIVGFIHTHPSWVAFPSSTDYHTMRSLVCAVGKPLLCAIDGTDGKRFHWFLDDEGASVEVQVLSYGQCFWGIIPKGK